MSYVKKTVTTNTNETEFMKTFIRELTAADERIVCESDDATINNATTDNAAAIYIKINDSCKIKILRYNSSRYQNMGYYFAAIINNKEYRATNFNYMNGSSDPSTIVTRTYNFSVISNDNVIFISIGNFANSTIESGNFFMLSVDYDNFTAAGAANSFSSLNTLYCTDEANNNISISIFNRLPYFDTSGAVSIIDSKILVNAGANTKFTEVSTGMIDCSYIASPNIITTEFGRYFVLNGYTLIPIVEE